MADKNKKSQEEQIQSHIQSLCSHLEAELDVSTALKENSKKLPKDCLDSMRQVAEKIKEDDWMYPSVNKLLGLQ